MNVLEYPELARLFCKSRLPGADGAGRVGVSEAAVTWLKAMSGVRQERDESWVKCGARPSSGFQLRLEVQLIVSGYGEHSVRGLRM